MNVFSGGGSVGGVGGGGGGGGQKGVSTASEARSSIPEKEIIVLGCEGSGKSLLLRRIKESWITAAKTDQHRHKWDLQNMSLEMNEMTVPTIGVDLVSLRINSDPFIVREIGSTMSSRWDSYIPHCWALVYMIDASDLGGIAQTMIYLYETFSLTNPQNQELLLKGKHVVIVFNKLDLCDESTSEVVCNILRLDELCRDMHGQFSIMKINGHCMDYSLSSSLKEWIVYKLLEEKQQRRPEEASSVEKKKEETNI